MTGARPPLFRGPQSLRVRGERAVLLAVLACLPLTIVVLGVVLQHSITWQQAMLLLVVAMVYVTLSRGRLLGGGLRVHPGQFGHVYEIVDACAQRIGVPTPQVFVRDDPFVPIVGVGIGEPYAIVISGQYLEHLKPEELRFLIGREIGQIASGNARLTSLLSANGRENALVSIAFGPWLRRIEYTADRVGLLCCGSLDAAISAIAVQTLHSVGRRVDLAAFAEQQRELAAEPMLRAGEWLSATPYATYRIAALREFATSSAYAGWLPYFASALPAAVEPALAPGRRIFVGPVRRFVAFLIDTSVLASAVSAIFPNTRGAVVIKLDDDGAAAHLATPPPQPPSTLHRAIEALNASHDSASQTFGSWLGAYENVVHWFQSGSADSFMPLIYLTYVIVMVGLIGRTVGMLLCDVQVTAADGSRVGLVRSAIRYVCALLNVVWIPGWFSLLRPVAFYDRLSGTRLVAGNASAAAIRTTAVPSGAAAAPEPVH